MLDHDDCQFYGSTRYPKHMSTLSHNPQKLLVIDYTIHHGKEPCATRYPGRYFETSLSSSKTASLGLVNFTDWAYCILNKSENATPELFAIYIQNDT